MINKSLNWQLQRHRSQSQGLFTTFTSIGTCARTKLGDTEHFTWQKFYTTSLQWSQWLLCRRSMNECIKQSVQLVKPLTTKNANRQHEFYAESNIIQMPPPHLPTTTIQQHNALWFTWRQHSKILKIQTQQLEQCHMMWYHKFNHDWTLTYLNWLKADHYSDIY